MKESIGALWKKTSKKGVEFFSGSVEINNQKLDVVVFTNNKTKETHPDYKIYLSEKQNTGKSVPVDDNPFNDDQIPL